MLSYIRKELEVLAERGLYRSLSLVQGDQYRYVMINGRKVLLLCSNNYLGLAIHPALKEAAISAVEKYGTGTGASRLVSGNMELHAVLEKRIAALKGTESALLFNSGYAANTGIIPALVGRGDLIFSDRLNHASIVDGAVLSRAKLIRYPHNDIPALRKLLDKNRSTGRKLIVTDAVFSMDGDIAPLKELADLKREYNAILMVDDAHGTGVLGASGSGTSEMCGVACDVDIQMGTLGKALGSFGAYAAASGQMVEYLINRARSFIFSTSLPPAVLAASIAAIDLIRSEAGKLLRERLSSNSKIFRDSLESQGFNCFGSNTQIVPIQTGEAPVTMEFTRRLLDHGCFAQGIRPPTVPAGRCRLRCTLMATHTPEELILSAEVIAGIGRELGVLP